MNIPEQPTIPKMPETKEVKGTKMNNEAEMITRKTWDEFRATGLPWYINTIMQVFGWSLAFETNDEQTNAITIKNL